jgi:hypothetical protein
MLPHAAPQPLVHGAMLGVWRKTPAQQRNRCRKTMQTPKATATNCRLVAAAELPCPHEEKENIVCSFYRGEEGGVRAASFFWYMFSYVALYNGGIGKNRGFVCMFAVTYKYFFALRALNQLAIEVGSRNYGKT